MPHHCYSSRLVNSNHALKKIKSDINALLIDNSDHFSDNAKDAYKIGHTYALSVAREAGERNDIEGLKRAYAFDAYACHFLTDLFASGHIRNQRGKLETFLITRLEFSADWAKKLAGILTGAQHEKEGKEGLNVENGKREQWRAYGDGSFFTPKNKENKEKAIAATQQSVDEIFRAYDEASKKASPSLSTVYQLIPFVTPYNNPRPLYSIEEDSLFLYQDYKKIPIRSRFDYLTKGISQAIRWLPEEYISGFITPDFRIEFPDAVEAINKIISEGVKRVVVPQIERVTGFVWHIIGIATYRQVKQYNQQLSGKIDEMADTIEVTYRNSSEILRQVDQLLWENLLKEIQGPIATIKDISHQIQIHKEVALDEKQLQKAEIKLWNAYIRMSRVSHEGFADGRRVLAAYESKLKSQGSKAIKSDVTLLFRQMLQYQVQAFSLYATLRIMRNGYQQHELSDQVSEFEASLVTQIEINKSHIDETSIDKLMDPNDSQHTIPPKPFAEQVSSAIIEFKKAVSTAVEMHTLDKSNWGKEEWKNTWIYLSQDVLDDACAKVSEVKMIFSQLGLVESRSRSKLLSRVNEKKADDKSKFTSKPNEKEVINYYRPISDFIALRVSCCDLKEIDTKIQFVQKTVLERKGVLYLRGQSSKCPNGEYKEGDIYKDITQYAYVYFKEIGYPIEIQLNHEFATYAFEIDSRRRNENNAQLRRVFWGVSLLGDAVKKYILTKSNNPKASMNKEEIIKIAEKEHSKTFENPEGLSRELRCILTDL